MKPPLLLTIYVFTLITGMSFTKVNAEDEDVNSNFKTAYEVKYAVTENSLVEVTHNVIITNLKSDLIVSGYSILIRQPEITDISGESKDRKVEVTKTSENDMTKLTARFNDFIIGEGKENKLTIRYKTKDIVTRIGKVWNLNIPKVFVTENMEKYDINIDVPISFGELLNISPAPYKLSNEGGIRSYHYTKDLISDKGITASFGAYQDINYKLIYELKNDGWLRTHQEIALPPEIPYSQQIKYTSINPQPKYIKKDQDDNVILGYQIDAKGSLNIQIIGNARITNRQIDVQKGGAFANIPKSYKKYIQSEKYWESKSDIVKKLATQLKDPSLNVSQNAFKAYDYVIKNFKYDLDIERQDYLQRKGAERTLLDKTNLGCMEFTDLFIAITRAMGIPSRQLNGYALTTEGGNKPVSIILSGQDKLHAWPEFFDPSLGWVQVDPTWGNTSGVDYFTKLDTNHFVFVIRGVDPEFPLSAGEYRFNNEADLVDVEFSESGIDTDYSPKYKINKLLTLNPVALFSGQRLFEIHNTGDTFFYLENGEAVLPGGFKNTYLPKDSNKIILKDFNDGQSIYTF